MANENNTELGQNINQDDLQKQLKEIHGIEFFHNDLLPEELEKQGYKKISLDDIYYVEQLFKHVPQLMVNKVKKGTVEQAFKVATENSYRCLLDPSMHLATRKGTEDVFLGTALANDTNQIRGQASWIKNDSILSFTSASQVALNAFNALSTVTGQYFMAQVNSNLLDIKDKINSIKQYMDDVKQSELEAAFQELNEISDHILFIKEDPKRIHNTITQIDAIRLKVRSDINLYKKPIDRIIDRKIEDDSKLDKDKEINENMVELKNNILKYHNAVYVYTLAQIQKIYLSSIIDVEELIMFRNEIYEIVEQYKKKFVDTTIWSRDYINQAIKLNEASMLQNVFARTGGILGYVYGSNRGNYKLEEQAESLVNDVFNVKRKKKKEDYILRHNEYQTHYNDMELIDTSIAALDRYINMISKSAEIVSVEEGYFIKYIEEK